MVTQERLRREVRVSTRGFREPEVTVRLNGVAVSPGAEREIVVTDAATDPPPDGPAVPGRVVVRAALLDGVLRLENRPEDGNVELVVTAECREQREPGAPPSRATAPVAFVGRRTTVPGLEEANAGCFRAYLQRHQDLGPEPAAVADLLRAQLRRPRDPLWDPDPLIAGLDARIALEDPVRVRVAEWAQAEPLDRWEFTRRGPQQQGGGVTRQDGQRVNPRDVIQRPNGGLAEVLRERGPAGRRVDPNVRPGQVLRPDRPL